MKNHSLHSRLNRLQYLFDQAPLLSGVGLELQADWAKYLCVLCAGFIEVGLSELYGSYVTKGSSEPVARFATQSLRRIRNPNHEKFLQTAGAFDTKWKEELQEFMGEEGRQDAINSIMNNRNKIAHGQDSDITIVRLRVWFSKSVAVLEYIEKQMQP